MTINNGSTDIRVPLTTLTPLMSETIDMPKDLLGIIGTYYNDPNIPASGPYLPTQYTSMTDYLYALTSEISNVAKTSSGKQIDSALKTLENITNTFMRWSHNNPHYFCDTQYQEAPDKMTIHDDLLNLASRIQTCSQIVRTCLDNEQHLARYSETLDEAQEALTHKCHRLDINTQYMIESADTLASKMIIDRDALIDVLDDAIDLPTHILGATTEYSLGSTVTPLVHEAAQIPTDLAEIIEEYYIDPQEHIGS